MLKSIGIHLGEGQVFVVSCDCFGHLQSCLLVQAVYTVSACKMRGHLHSQSPCLASADKWLSTGSLGHIFISESNINIGSLALVYETVMLIFQTFQYELYLCAWPWQVLEFIVGLHLIFLSSGILSSSWILTGSTYWQTFEHVISRALKEILWNGKPHETKLGKW